MKKTPEDIEEIIKQVLQGLGDAEAPAGMERRILAAIADRAAAASPTSTTSAVARLWFKLWFKLRSPRTTAPGRTAPPWALPLALAGAAAVLLAVLFPQRPTPPASRRTLPQTQLVQAGLTPSPTPSRVLHPVAAKAASRRRVNTPLTRKTPPLSADDLRCLRELHAPSHPAPPQPLTAEEKLLLRIALAAEPQQLAMLDPELRARQQATSAADFERFVHPSPSTDQQPPTNQ